MPVKRTILHSKFATTCLGLFIAGSVLQTTACHRGYYRRQADAEAVQLITEKANDPRWALPDRSIDVDPRSRMAHPFSADHSPMPPDDPSSHEFMHKVDGKPGFPQWSANGELDEVENPEWMSFVPLNEKGELVLDLNRAVRVAYLHSPSYQTQRETLYQSALDVSLERFGFDTQLFAAYNSFLTADGKVRGGGGSSSTLGANTGARGIRLQKLGITGSTLVVGLANTLLWQFSGPTTNSASSLVDFSLLQPLLRGAGRERIMESLTQAERTLLANVRQMERFRRGFYLSIVTGRNPGQGPSRGGNFLNTPGSQGNNAGGFLGLLQSRQNIFIQEYNVAQLRNVLDQFRFLQGAQRISAIQVSLVETQLYRAQESLFRSTVNYEAALDNFKITLGLPPELKIDIDDPLLDRFQLIDAAATRKQDEINRLKETVSLPLTEIAILMEDPIRALNAEQQLESNPRNQVAFVWDDVVEQRVRGLIDYLNQIEVLRTSVVQGQQVSVTADIERLRAARTDRVTNLRKLSKIDLTYGRLEDAQNAQLREELVGESAVADPDMILGAVNRAVQELDTQLPKSLAKIRKSIEEILASHENTPETKKKLESEILQTIPQALAEVSNQSLELLLQQVLARTDLVELPEINLDSSVAVAIAKTFRRDWMNARASLVDTWRQIEFQADQLESTFDLVLEGDIGTVGDNPINFRTANGRLRGGFRFDSPITRLQERNNYRNALINYQQARRSYYQVRDEISRNLRQILRQVELNKVVFELNRLQIKVGVRQVDQATFRVAQPPAAGEALRGRSTADPTLGRDLTDAISNLQGAQTAFLGTWATYETLRRGLDFDLGTMQLDENSLWIDPGAINRAFVDRLVAEDQALLNEMGMAELFDSQDDFMKQTTPDLDSEVSPESPPPTEADDAALLKLKMQLRNELTRTVSLPRQTALPTPPSSLTLSPPATSQFPPVDVASAFPLLPSVQSSLPSPAITVDQLPGRSATPLDLSQLPTPADVVSPKRFRPIVPE